MMIATCGSRSAKNTESASDESSEVRDPHIGGDAQFLDALSVMVIANHTIDVLETQSEGPRN